MKLWPFQHTTVDKIRDRIAAGSRRILLVSPTGSGKTVMAAHLMTLAQEKFKDSLFVAHRREIIHQTSEKLDRFECDHGLMLAGERGAVMARTQVASVQTFSARVLNGTYRAPRADVIFFDEAHRSLAPSYQKLLALYPDAILVGLTATPVRGDGRGLGSTYDEIVESISIRELIEQGYLVTPRVYAPVMPDLSGVHIKRGDYDSTELEAAMDRQELVGSVVDDWKVRAGDRKTVVFASGVQHSKHLCEVFRNSGVKAEHIDGTTDKQRRDEVLYDLEHGELQVVTNCDVLLEGWDCPPISCAIYARPTRSYGLYLQMAGRVLRKHPGKEDCILIDHAGAVYRHGFVQDAGDWSLDPDTPIEERRKKTKEETTQPMTCRECFTVYEGRADCPKCGWMPTKEARAVNMAEGRLKEIKHIKIDSRQRTWNECLFKCVHRNLKMGAAAHMYRKKVGVWPQGLKTVPETKAEWAMKGGAYYEYWKQNNIRNYNAT
jgi:superfamily II DNA or RNA helicase